MTHTDVERARRRAENENLFRESGADVDNLDLHCECGENACAERLAVSEARYSDGLWLVNLSSRPGGLF